MNFMRGNPLDTVQSNLRATLCGRFGDFNRNFSEMNFSSSPSGINGTFSTPTSPVNTWNVDLTAAFLSLVMFLALFGNGLVILAFYRFHVLRTITNYFVVSLAVADILVASLSTPAWMYILLSGITKIPKEGQFLKKVLYYSWQYIDILCSTASIVNLCIISVDRHLAINSPLTYHSRMTSRRAKASIAFAWLFAFFCASLSIVTVIKTIMPMAGRVYAIFISLTAFFLPLLILIVVYGKICRVAIRQVRDIRSAHSGIQHGIQREHSVTFRRELKITKTLGIVVGAFILCWGPFFSLVVVYAVCQTCPDNRDWVEISKWLHYSNSTINPLIYMLFTRSFRSAFRRILLRGLCCKGNGRGSRFNLGIWKNGSVEPTGMFSQRTIGVSEVQRRVTGIDNDVRMLSMEQKTQICQLSLSIS